MTFNYFSANIRFLYVTSKETRLFLPNYKAYEAKFVLQTLRVVKNKDASLSPEGHVLMARRTRPYDHKHVRLLKNPLPTMASAEGAFSVMFLLRK